ncbi:MAG: hypothetical protein JXQ96_13560 [Cyclobacteriaceae bacterium]
MKTSNKILTYFLSVIAVYMLVFALDLRLFGRHSSDRFDPDMDTHVISVGGFKYIKLDKIKSLSIVPSPAESYYLEIKYSSDSNMFHYLSKESLESLGVSISDDTLMLQGDNKVKLNFDNFKLFVPSTTEFLSASNSNFRFENFDTDSLKIDISKSQIYGKGLSSIKKLGLVARNDSKVHINDKYNLDSLNVKLEDSRVHINRPIKWLDAEIDKKSNLNAKHVDEIKIKKEKGGKVYLR